MHKNNDKKKVLVPRSSVVWFREQMFAADVTEFAELDTTRTLPPTLPVSVYKTQIVSALEKAGYTIIASDVAMSISATGAFVYRDYFRKVELTDEARYALATIKPRFQSEYQRHQNKTVPKKLSRESEVKQINCSIATMIEVRTGAWLEI